MNRMSRWMFAAAAALIIAPAVPACGGKKEEPKPVAGSAEPAGSAAATGSGSGSAAAVAGSGSGSGSAVAADSGSGSGSAAADPDVPTEVDFEAEAKAKITEKNLETQVKAVEKELGR